ncbi:hypothetical protein H6G97_44495 [Nostoc flagelliforme FACHB-838]|uniref:Uncharacterized protein n=1 Tax=Nostoc flagelliforme FACHB-838 TaxID=2692904 RepID=A0ABR8E669_9NOSO|nr:hypothetical protein [Nostoc flagelliforme]MBD2536010.1 hypothetical protein [Nostoc flagelliforme FACHB-838]
MSTDCRLPIVDLLLILEGKLEIFQELKASSSCNIPIPNLQSTLSPIRSEIEEQAQSKGEKFSRMHICAAIPLSLR